MSFTQLRTPNLGIIYTGGLCLQAVRQAFGIGAKYPTAMDDWTSGRTHSGPPPKGVAVPVYFSLGSTPAGHIAIHLPDGRVASSTQNGTHRGLYIHPNLNDLIRIYAKYNRSCTYLGWSTEVNDTPVVEERSHDMTKLEDFRNCFITQANRWPNDTEIAAWQKSGMEPYAWVQRYGHFPMKEERDAALAQVEKLEKQLSQGTVDPKTLQKARDLDQIRALLRG